MSNAPKMKLDGTPYKTRSRRDPNAPKIERTPIDEVRFVRVYVDVANQGGNLMDVSKAVGCSYAGARVKAERLQSAGVNLPELAGGRRAKSFDVAALNAAIEAELDG